MMDAELVRRRGWLTREKFLDLLGASNLIPGPSSSEVAIHIGYLLGGWPGLVIAGVCFVLPATLMMTALAWAYERFGQLPFTAAILYGIKPVVIAVILQALWSLGKSAIKSVALATIAVAAAGLALYGLQPITLLLVAGIAALLLKTVQRGEARSAAASLLPSAGAASPKALLAATASTGGAALAPVALTSLFLVFLKIGAVIFGSGYVLLAFLRTDLVVRHHWLSDSQLVDAVALGQVTPGPVFTTATFIGYLLAGPSGAAVATVGIFLPAFVLVAASGPLIPRIRQSAAASTFLDGVIAASLALMTVVTWQLTRVSLIDAPTVILAAVALFLLLRFKVNSAWLVGLGAVVGLTVQFIHRL